MYHIKNYAFSILAMHRNLIPSVITKKKKCSLVTKQNIFFLSGVYHIRKKNGRRNPISKNIIVTFKAWIFTTEKKV